MTIINLPLVARMLSPALLAMAVIGLIPLTFGLITDDGSSYEFPLMSGCAVIISQLLKKAGKSAKANLGIRELFLFTVTLWLLSAVIAALPIFLMLKDLSFIGAFFESVSALSTTGATVIDDLASRPRSILLWRSMMQFLGGIGFVVLAAAALPSFASGGINIFKTESNSFDDAAKITPHLKTMAFALLTWYIITAAACIISYLICGLPPFLAVNAALCTVSTGGMMPLDSSMNDLGARAQYTAIVFMYLGALPFLVLLGCLSFNIFKIFGVFKNEQVRGYSLFILIITAMVFISLILGSDYPLEKTFRTALFNTVSILSTTGFALDDFTSWNGFVTALFIMIFAIGGCSGSTAGGIKFFRIQVCCAMFKAQFIRSIHPSRMVEPRFNGARVDVDSLRAVITFLVAWIMVFMVSSVIAATLGLNITDAVTATITMLSNVGPAMGPELGPRANFAGIGDPLLLLFSLDMLMGRLEIIPVLLCLTRMFWRL